MSDTWDSFKDRVSEVPLVILSLPNTVGMSMLWEIESPSGESGTWEGPKVAFIPQEVGDFTVRVYLGADGMFEDEPAVTTTVNFPEDFDGYTEEDVELANAIVDEYFDFCSIIDEETIN